MLIPNSNREKTPTKIKNTNNNIHIFNIMVQLEYHLKAPDPSSIWIRVSTDIFAFLVTLVLHFLTYLSKLQNLFTVMDQGKFWALRHRCSNIALCESKMVKLEML